MRATLTVLLAVALLWASPAAFQAAQSTEDSTPADIACGETIYEDDFSDANSAWMQRANESVELAYTDDGAYRMATSVESNVLWSWAPVNADQLPDGFCLSVRAQELNDGDEDDGRAVALGLAFAGEPNVPSLHTFGVAPASGVFRVRDRDFDDEVSTNVVDWTQSDALASAGSWNELTIRVDGQRVQFVINGERVHEADLDATGAPGLFLESFDDADVAGIFDDFSIRALASD